MKPIVLLPVLITIVSAILGACASDPLSPADDRHIMPLKVGNRWVGRSQEFDSTGLVTKTDYDTIEIVGEEILNGETWYVTSRRLFFINREDGLWLRSSNYTSYLAKYPAAVGDVFGRDTLLLYTRPDSLLVGSFRVRSVHEKVNVPAGEFDAIRYMTDIHTIDGTPYRLNTSDYGYVPGIGLVEVLYYGISFGGTRVLSSKWELVQVVLE